MNFFKSFEVDEVFFSFSPVAVVGEEPLVGGLLASSTLLVVGGGADVETGSGAGASTAAGVGVSAVPVWGEKKGC